MNFRRPALRVDVLGLVGNVQGLHLDAEFLGRCQSRVVLVVHGVAVLGRINFSLTL
jgi:hypothetical protein